jgi:hypothetical protein
MLGDVPRPGWHTWVALIALIAIGLLGMFTYWALKF